MNSSPDELAALFVAARRTRAAIVPPQSTARLDLEAAYRVQRQFRDQYCVDGSRHPAGFKLTATTSQAQSRLSVTDPIVGTLFSDDIVRGPAILRRSEYNVPMVEAEVAFVLTRDLPELCSRELILSSTSIAPAIEVADSRLAGWPGAVGSYSVEDIVIDNALSGSFVLGDPVPATEIDLADVRVEFRVDDAVLVAGAPAVSPVDPVSLVGWLARSLHRIGGRLTEGTIIATGAVAGPTPLVEGTARVDMGALGSVSVTLTAGEP